MLEVLLSLTQQTNNITSVVIFFLPSEALTKHLYSAAYAIAIEADTFSSCGPCMDVSANLDQAAHRIWVTCVAWLHVCCNKPSVIGCVGDLCSFK